MRRDGLCYGSVARRHHRGKHIRAGPLHRTGEAEPGILRRHASLEPAPDKRGRALLIREFSGSVRDAR